MLIRLDDGSVVGEVYGRVFVRQLTSWAEWRGACRPGWCFDAALLPYMAARPFLAVLHRSTGTLWACWGSEGLAKALPLSRQVLIPAPVWLVRKVPRGIEVEEAARLVEEGFALSEDWEAPNPLYGPPPAQVGGKEVPHAVR